MKKLLNLTKHISEENLTKLSLLLFFTISFLIIISIVLHPYVSDDYHYQNMITNEYQNFFDYFFSRYYDWSGRFFQNIITYFIYSNYIFELFYKILIFPIFFVTCHLIWFKIANFNKKNNHFDFYIFLILTWFIIPVPAETIVWIIGSTVYIYPLMFGILYLSYINNSKNIFQNKLELFFLLIIAFVAGSSQIQLSVACLVISSFMIFNYYKTSENKKIFYSNFLVYIFFLLGFAFLILAPGNYSRLSNIQDFSFFSNLYKFIIFITSAYFYLGDIKSFLIFFLSLIVFRYIFVSTLEIKLIYNKNIYPWLLASIASLLVNIVVINFVSFRSLFFPIVFFIIFYLKLIRHSQASEKLSNIFIKKIIVFSLLFGFLIDSTYNFTSIYYYNAENQKRENLIEKSLSENKKIIEVPYYSIIPSRLTHIQTPEHDYAFLKSYEEKNNATFKHSDNKPMSKNVYKQIKFLFRKKQ